ncbi:VOC family protein [Marinicrinis lubricantis]|uniref:VOC family protein n=1 Tax=Marinicrinis lubricantis TaxID=2086470 RepID=A0ABW1IKR3_9BACL
MNFHQNPNTFASEVHLLVSDLNRSISFYTEVIGFKVLEQSDSKAIFTADGAAPLLTVTESENVQPMQPRRTGLYHFALLLPTRRDLAKALRHLVQTGYPLQGASDHLVSEAIYLGDPDGNGIEIYADRPKEDWSWRGDQVVMSTEPLHVEELMSLDDQEAWTGLPSGTIMGHIHLHVADLHAAEQFYCNGLGFDIVTQYGTQALFISTGSYHHHIGLNTWNGVGAAAPDPNHVGLLFYTLVLPSQVALNETIQRLQQIGAWVEEQHSVTWTKDPSGNLIELRVG